MAEMADAVVDHDARLEEDRLRGNLGRRLAVDIEGVGHAGRLEPGWRTVRRESGIQQRRNCRRRRRYDGGKRYSREAVADHLPI